MTHWPPSPLVEDEVTALSHEHVNLHNVKSEDDPVVSRGTVDQYPIIVDSDDQRTSGQVVGGRTTEKENGLSDRDTSDDSTGPQTPSPVNERRQRCASPPHTRGKNVSFGDTPTSSDTSKKSGHQSSTPRGRPEVSRIETNLGDDLKAMASGSRRAPSPYSYSRVVPAEKLSSPTNNSLFSAVDFTTSPVQTPGIVTPFATASTHDSPGTNNKQDTGESSRRRRPLGSSERDRKSEREDVQSTSADKKATRRIPEMEKSSSHHSSHRHDIQQARTLTLTPPHSRTVSRESSYGSAAEDHATVHRTTRPGQGSDPSHESAHTSPHTSSAEESRRRSHYRQDGQHRSGEYCAQRPSSHRRERPHMDDLFDRIESVRPSQFPNDEPYTQARPTAQPTQFNLSTPMTADAARKMTEDYFEQALSNPRHTRKSLNVVTTGSALTSPLSSPPRTPRSERQSKDYLDASALPQRPVQRSRPPSMDEGQIKELRAHASLLSAATAGAAMAARASGELSKPGASSAGHNSSTSTSKATSTPRSRRPSPVSEASRSSAGLASHTSPETVYSPQPSVTVANEPRPSSRSSTHAPDHPGFPLSQRSSSYSGPGPAHTGRYAYASSPVDARHGPSVLHPPTAVPASRASISARPGDARSANPEQLTLPKCPRPQPTSAHNDWWSVKEMSEIDICPTCVSVISNTRYRDLFIRSLPRPYNQKSVCAMSQPWMRIAFLQALRQGRSNLEYMRALSNVPKNMNPCQGEKAEQRRWFRIEDPSTRTHLPNFVACSACVRAIDTIFPELEDLFKRPRGTLAQEMVCSLNIYSRNFPGFINQLELAASRCKGAPWRAREAQPLVDHLRQATRYQECAKDRMLTTRAWHFIPDLPEFTVCEECYIGVVWPISDKPVAREVSKTAKLVPIPSDSVEIHGISCQLYSERMRKIFHEAINSRNFPHLRDAARARYAAQQRLTNLNRIYDQDQLWGIDRRAELAKNNEIWRTWE